MSKNDISADFPYESKFIDVHGSRMHYVERGEGDPILLLHGNPTSCYLWRNIIPHLEDQGRCIAPDLIGMGKSDKPSLDYRFVDHAKYLAGFVDGLGLDKITLVIHDWGSGLGLHYASKHPEKIRGIAMMEAILRPLRWADFPKDFKTGFKIMRSPLGWFMISVMNAFVEQILPKATVRALTQEEMDHYRAPYPNVASRKPVRQWPCEIPIDGEPADMHEIVTGYSKWLQSSELPKLLLYADPGGIITKEGVDWCREHLSNLETEAIGDGLHYVQEDHPHEIGQAIARWRKGLDG